MYKYILFSLILFSSACNTSNEGGVAMDHAKVIIENDTTVVIVDVRTPEETAEGMIKGAINIDYKAADFEDKIMQLDKNDHYLLYCKSGNRSRKAYSVMKEKGFKYILTMNEGYEDYINQK